MIFMGNIIGPTIPTIPVSVPLGQVLLVLQIAKELLPIVSEVGKILLQRPDEERAEIMGYKAEQAMKEGIKPDDFDSIGEYLDYLNEKIDIDSAKFGALSEAEMLKYSTIGASLYSMGISQKFNILISPALWQAAAAIGLQVNEIADAIMALADRNIENADIVPDYLKGDLRPGSKEYRIVYKIIDDILRNRYPDLDDNAIADKHDEMRKNNYEE